MLACAHALLGAPLPAALGSLAPVPWIVDSLLDGWAGADRRRRLGFAAEHVLDPRSWPELVRTRWPNAIEAAAHSGALPHVRPLAAQLRRLSHGAGALAGKLYARLGGP